MFIVPPNRDSERKQVITPAQWSILLYRKYDIRAASRCVSAMAEGLNDGARRARVAQNRTARGGGGGEGM